MGLLSSRVPRPGALRARAGALALVVGLGTLALPGLPAAEASVTTVVGASADARVSESRPSSNYGTSHLRVDGGTDPDLETYLRFDVTGLAGTITSAKVRLHAFGSTQVGFSIYATSTAWSESTINWTNRPSSTSEELAGVGAVQAGAWAELDVTSAITGDGSYGFVVRTTSTDGTEFDSREAAAEVQPAMVILTDVGAAPSSTTAPIVLGLPEEGQPLAADPGKWSGTAPVAYTHQWERCDPSGGGCAPIEGDTTTTHAVADSDVGSTLRVQVTATNDYGASTAVSDPTAVVAPQSTDVHVVAGAGNIAGCTQDRDEATASVLDEIAPEQVFTLGDNAYESGTAEEFAQCYDPTWGRHKAITHPSAGNHEYATSGAAGYFGYFGAAAGDPALGYYAYDVGTWRVYVLNSACDVVSCAAGGAQEQWLRQDLAAHPRACTAAYIHEPRFSSSALDAEREDPAVADLYAAFYEASGDLWLAAHAHQYERLTRLDPTGAIDTAAGVRNFIVGTGGAGLGPIGTAITGSEARGSSYGVLKLTLSSTSYAWRFVAAAGSSFSDAGSDTCSGASIDEVAPSVPTGLTATAVAVDRVDLNWGPAYDEVGVVGYEVSRDGAPAATLTAVTGWSDLAVAPGETHAYEVTAFDAAGNRSSAAGPAVVTLGGLSTTLVLVPGADARVSEARPKSNYGTSHLRVDGGSDPDIESFLQFGVSGVGTVQQAVLRLHTFGGSTAGFSVYVAGNSWSESLITWANRPPLTSGSLASSGPVTTGTWVELDVTAAVTGNGSYSFALTGTSTDGVEIDAREVTDPAFRPQLVITST